MENDSVVIPCAHWGPMSNGYVKLSQKVGNRRRKARDYLSGKLTGRLEASPGM